MLAQVDGPVDLDAFRDDERVILSGLSDPRSGLVVHVGTWQCPIT